MGKNYIPPDTRNVDQIAEMYERLEKHPATTATTEGPERKPGDPFGLSEEPRDEIEIARENAVRLVKFMMLLASQDRMSPRGVLYMTELFALNVMNAQDMPLSPKEAEKVRKAAFEYYSTSLKKIPDPKPKR